jgi:hypothetical protein
MNGIWPFFLLLCFWQKTNLQTEPQYQLLHSFEIKRLDFFSTDHLGNVYTIIGDEIQMRDPSGKKLWSYSDPLQGKIRSIDTFNPMRVLLHHDSFFSISFLDNRLNPNRGIFEPVNYGYWDVQLVSSIDEDRVWFYDQTLDRLVLWNLSREAEEATSLTITQLLRKESQPVRLISRMDRVFLLVPGTGVMIFSQFGAYIKTHLVEDISDYLQIRNRVLFYRVDNTLVKFHLDTFESAALELPGNPDQIRIENHRLFARYGEVIKVFEIAS